MASLGRYRSVSFGVARGAHSRFARQSSKRARCFRRLISTSLLATARGAHSRFARQSCKRRRFVVRALGLAPFLGDCFVGGYVVVGAFGRFGPGSGRVLLAVFGTFAELL